MRLSSSSSSPDCELTSAMAESSSRLMALPWPLPPMRLVMRRSAGSMRVQVRMGTSILIMWTEGTTNARQNLAPMVLGMISERTRMSIVRMMAKTVSPLLSEMTSHWAPAPAAPMVWAMVLRVRMADRGVSTFSFILAKWGAYFFPEVSSV